MYAPRIPNYTAAIGRAPDPQVSSEPDGQEVRFQPQHLRPGVTLPLPKLHLTINTSYAGQHVVIGWRLTSTRVDGWEEGDVAYEVHPDPVAFNPREL
jgi:hypothetical protein